MHQGESSDTGGIAALVLFSVVISLIAALFSDNPQLAAYAKFLLVVILTGITLLFGIFTLFEKNKDSIKNESSS